MNNILITGANGQLGNELKDLSVAYPQYNFVFTDVGELDITDEDALEAFFNNQRITHVINCAAYTAVDKAEQEPERAFKLNATAAGNLARITREYEAHLIHISTDFVFEGKNMISYTEYDETNPLSVYGKSKLEGEQLVERYANRYAIIRTSWLYSSYGANFVKTMMKYGKERGELNVVNDQFGSPTYAADLAGLVMKVVERNTHGLFHYSNEGAISWYQFAKAIMELAGIDCKVNPIPSSEYPTPARRPGCSVMDKTKIKEEFDMEIPEWKDSLAKCMEKLKAEA